MRQKPNLLLLDEPTNHLDIEMREALTEALQDYDGALVVVAHDRHLLRATSRHAVAGGRRQGRAVRRRPRRLSRLGAGAAAAHPRRDDSPAAAGPGATAAAAPDRKAQKRAEAQARQRVADARKPLLARQAALEREMAALQAEKETLDAWLALPDAYAADAKDELKEKIARQGELTWQLARHETAWLELSEALDQVLADPEG